MRRASRKEVFSAKRRFYLKRLGQLTHLCIVRKSSITRITIGWPNPLRTQTCSKIKEQLGVGPQRLQDYHKITLESYRCASEDFL